MTSYKAFLETKHPRWSVRDSAPDLPVPDAHLFEWQRVIVSRVFRLQRGAIWADTGLGKTAMQLTWAHGAAVVTGRPSLILTPLAVGAQTLAEAARFGIPAESCRGRWPDAPVHVLNYEQLAHVDAGRYGAVVLDESSILKAYSGVTKQRLIETFADTPYRLCCTATPAPNDHLEIGNHAEFLGVMRSHEMIMRWFINDPMEAGAYRLKGHARAAFWEWVASWAVALRTPADWGFDASGFTLPELRVHRVSVGSVDLEPDDGHLFALSKSSATGLHRSLRVSSVARAERAAAIVAAEPGESWLVWSHTNYDADAFRAVCPDAVEVRGSDSEAKKEELLSGFSAGRIRVLLTKPSIAGFGLNWQHCARVVFLGPSYSYEEWYQAIRRVWRYGQQRPVEVYAVSADNESAVQNAIVAKAAAHSTLQGELIRASAKTLGLGGSPGLMTRTLTRDVGDGWELWTGDCVEGVATLPDASIDHCVFSPPFANLYLYSDGLADMGNCVSYDEFWEHYAFLARGLHRVMRPGRIVAVHCKDLPRYKGRDGSAGLYDFPGELIRVMTGAGFTYHSRVTIWKDPVIEMQRTKNHGLLYKQLRKDSCASRMGMADFVVAFRKWDGLGTDAEVGVPHTREEFPLERWQQWASPVWDDIQQTRVLTYMDAKSDEDERHICPLQLDVIERCLTLWSNPGDVVLSPFAGIGSEGYESIRLGRRYIGFELKPEYAQVAVKHLRAAEHARRQGCLFSMTGASA
jgi:hypothetical protein